jgi:hypothetical protein
MLLIHIILKNVRYIRRMEMRILLLPKFIHTEFKSLLGRDI